MDAFPKSIEKSEAVHWLYTLATNTRAMAHQAFLAMQRRNLSRDTTGARNGRALYGSSSFSTNRRRSGVNGSLSAGEQIRDALLADKDRLCVPSLADDETCTL